MLSAEGTVVLLVHAPERAGAHPWTADFNQSLLSDCQALASVLSDPQVGKEKKTQENKKTRRRRRKKNKRGKTEKLIKQKKKK